MLRRLLATQTAAQSGEIPNVQWPAPEPAAPPGSMIVKPEPERCPNCGTCPTCGR